MPTISRFTKHFRLLGLPKTANEEQIRSRYKELAKNYHPDKVGQDETDEANAYMMRITEARDILLNSCFVIRKTLDLPSSDEQSIPRLNHLKREKSSFRDMTHPCSAHEHPPRTSAPLQSQIKHQPPATSFNIDVAEIRTRYSTMTNAEILSYLRSLVHLDSTELKPRERGSKALNVVFATEQHVRNLFLKQRNQNSLSEPELNALVSKICESELTKEWAQNSKTTCCKRLVEEHGLDWTSTTKWTHWEMINKLVKLHSSPSRALTHADSLPSTTTQQKSPINSPCPIYTSQKSGAIPSESLIDTTTSNPGSSTGTHEDLIIRFCDATKLTVEWANQCLEYYKWDYDTSMTHFENQLCVGTVQSECFVDGKIPLRLEWCRQEEKK